MTRSPASRRTRESRRAVPEDGEGGGDSSGVGRGTFDHGRVQQLPIVGGSEMLDVESVGPDHPPRTAEHRVERLRGDKIVGIDAREKRQREQGLPGVEEKDESVALDGRVDLQAGKIGNDRGGGDADAAAVGAVTPLVEWTLKGLPVHATRTEVGAQVSAAAVENAQSTCCGAESDQAPAEHVARDRPAAQLAGTAEQIPGRRISGKAFGRWGVRDGQGYFSKANGLPRLRPPSSRQSPRRWRLQLAPARRNSGPFPRRRTTGDPGRSGGHARPVRRPAAETP